jgi:hypothetical protein
MAANPFYWRMNPDGSGSLFMEFLSAFEMTETTPTCILIGTIYKAPDGMWEVRVTAPIVRVTGKMGRDNRNLTEEEFFDKRVVARKKTQAEAVKALHERAGRYFAKLAEFVTPKD